MWLRVWERETDRDLKRERERERAVAITWRRAPRIYWHRPAERSCHRFSWTLLSTGDHWDSPSGNLCTWERGGESERKKSDQMCETVARQSLLLLAASSIITCVCEALVCVFFRVNIFNCTYHSWISVSVNWVFLTNSCKSDGLSLLFPLPIFRLTGEVSTLLVLAVRRDDTSCCANFLQELSLHCKCLFYHSVNEKLCITGEGIFCTATAAAACTSQVGSSSRHQTDVEAVDDGAATAESRCRQFFFCVTVHWFHRSTRLLVAINWDRTDESTIGERAQVAQLMRRIHRAEERKQKLQ